jgi:hypothetical protein
MPCLNCLPYSVLDKVENVSIFFLSLSRLRLLAHANVCRGSVLPHLGTAHRCDKFHSVDWNFEAIFECSLKTCGISRSSSADTGFLNGSGLKKVRQIFATHTV